MYTHRITLQLKSILTLCLISVFFCGFSQVDVHGHRGTRGLFPENSLPAFFKALELKVDFIELDVVITKDKKVVVSHEAWINDKICFDPNGNRIPKNSKELNIYHMKYSEVKKCDCGTLPNPNFPDQKKQPVYKPLLWDVLKVIEKEARKTNTTIKYNIELKSNPSGDQTFHPIPEEFTQLVQQALQKIPTERILIQSFDSRILQEWRKKYPLYKLSLLAENPLQWKKDIVQLGFNPDYYSPNYQNLTEKIINDLHKVNIQVVPWTVNNKQNIDKLIQWGIDGIITDYPNFLKP